MYLLKPFQGGIAIEMDPELVQPVRQVQSPKEKVVGNAHETHGHTVAIYAERGSLYLQIDMDRFDFRCRDLVIEYYHNITTRDTTFCVRHPGFEFLLSYPAWWADIPAFEPVEPEMDQDNDYYAYLHSIWRNPSLQSKLIKSWSGSERG